MWDMALDLVFLELTVDLVADKRLVAVPWPIHTTWVLDKVLVLVLTLVHLDYPHEDMVLDLVV